jgi:hypothetical protein
MATITYNNANNWTCPASQTVMVECWGSGGGGASGAATVPAGGGGGGSYARSNIAVVKGQVYRIYAPAGGANGASNANGAAGGATRFTIDNGANGLMNLVQAAGGGGGVRTNAAGPAGTVANSIGNIAYAGGNAAAGVNATGIGGGGGAGGGNAAAGANASGVTGGAAANGGGKGGNGGAAGADAAEAGAAPGAGGGGSGNGTKLGKAGGVANVTITYNDAVTVSGKVTIGGANLADARVIVVSSDDNNAANTFFADVATSNAQGNWSATVSANKKIAAFAQHNNATAQYTSNAQPLIGT